MPAFLIHRRPHKLDGNGRPRSRGQAGPGGRCHSAGRGHRRPRKPAPESPRRRGARAGSPAPLPRALLLPRDGGRRETVSGVRATRSFEELKTLRRLSSEPGRCQARIQGSRSHSPPRRGRGRRRGAGFRRMRKGERGGAREAAVAEDGGGVTSGGRRGGGPGARPL